MNLKKLLNLLLITLVIGTLTSRSAVPVTDEMERIHSYTRGIEFDYVSWILDSLAMKASLGALDLEDYLPRSESHLCVVDYIQLTQQQIDLTNQISRIYADPQVKDPQANSRPIQDQLDLVNRQLARISPTAESILQEQVTTVIADLGLTAAGQPIPPVWFHSTPVPMALIVSPRNVIRQDANISLLADLDIDQITTLEDQVSQDLDVSALVAPIGGVGVYPTMVMRTSDLRWLTETIAHEWTHNYLTLRPLGVSYDLSNELRTMNETTASLAGKEIGAEVIRRYYPELNPDQPKPVPGGEKLAALVPEDQPFSFNQQMHTIRVHVDELLAKGKIEEAEKYMDDSRQVFLDHGYVVRKINQAYFAFYGAYADEAVGAAGADPVGPAVVALRQQSRSLADFLNRISWMTSFAQLQAAVQP